MKTTLFWAAAGLLLASATAGAQTAGTQTAGAQTKIVTPPGSTTEVTTTPAGDQIITVKVNNQDVNFEAERRPMMLSNRVMMPLRGVIEKLGGSVLWDPKERVVTGARPDTKDQFRIRVGSGQALLNGRQISLDAPPRIEKGTTYVPLRFVSEALGAHVQWDNDTRTVMIRSGSANNNPGGVGE